MLANLRDLAIVILAFQSIVIGVLLAILVVQVWRLVRLVRDEVKPILESTQETVGTVRGTTTFLSNHLAKPLIHASGYVSGLRQALRTLASFRRRPSTSPSSTQVTED